MLFECTVVNVVNLMKLVCREKHPHGLSNASFDGIFTQDKPVIFAFHGVPPLVQNLIFERTNRNFTIRGYMEEGTISTAFDMTVMNEIDRFHLVEAVCDKIANGDIKSVGDQTRWSATYVKQEMKLVLLKHKEFIREFGVDMEEIANWKWDIPV